jgi:hypothetical protein
MGSEISSFYPPTSPSIRDQAIKKGYFPKITPLDLENYPLFEKYLIGFKEIKSDDVVFDGPWSDSQPYMNKDLGDSVCEISFSARCHLVPAPSTENDHLYAYYLVDQSPCEPKRLIRAWVSMESRGRGSLKYQILS